MKAEAPTVQVDATPSKLTAPHPYNSPRIFTPNALPAATLPIYPALGQAPIYAGLNTRWLGSPGPKTVVCVFDVSPNELLCQRTRE